MRSTVQFMLLKRLLLRCGRVDRVVGRGVDRSGSGEHLEAVSRTQQQRWRGCSELGSVAGGVERMWAGLRVTLII